MRTLEDALDYFGYHPATPGPDGTGVKHAAVRDLFVQFVKDLWPLVPDGPDKTTFFRELWSSQTVAQVAIARTVPADWSATRSVARVLPEHLDSEGRPPGHPAWCGEGCIHVEPPTVDAQALDELEHRLRVADTQAQRVRDCIGGGCTCQERP